jgi:hypothetical protein
VTIEEVMAALEAGAGDAGDPNCPNFEYGGYTAYGCCLPTNFCGFLNPLNKQCIDPQTLPIQADTGPPVPCGSTVTDASADGI